MIVRNGQKAGHAEINRTDDLFPEGLLRVHRRNSVKSIDYGSEDIIHES